ncbi:MAG: hypothetical protein JWO09_2329 [Bacteroidetes bacterium]|nr:hypothetical protein [Bacteroidota bacterium]
MMNKFKKISSLFLIVFMSLKAFSQYGQLPPFSISLEAITGTAIPGLHSFAFAQSGDKWLIIGGRTNGLHGVNSNDGFPAEFKNDNVIVIDTTTWTSYTADLNQLPWNIADPMRSTNMEYVRDGDYLYMAGGFGFDSVASIYVTFPKLTAVHIDNMINAVINAQPIAPFIRQVSDTNLAVCGGDLGKIGNDYYLCFGHNFGGRYSDPPTPLFTQQYTDRIKKFNLTDDGTTITLNNYTYLADTNNFHRRDLNVGPIVQPDGSFALEAYGGVFKKTQNLPFLEPITITSAGTSVNMAYQQVMSHYTCANIPVFDSLSGSMYSTFLGGISLYDYNASTGLVAMDTLVPFINDITTMTTHSSGAVEETVLPVQLPGLLGSNAKFVLNENIAHYANEVIHIRNLPNTRVLAGYMLGGIRAQQGNFGTSAANDTVYRIYLTPNNVPIGIDELSSIQNTSLFPNPSSQSSTLTFSLKNTEYVKVSVYDLTGKEIMKVADEEMQKGNHQVLINTSRLPAGVYFCNIESLSGKKVLKVVVSR